MAKSVVRDLLQIFKSSFSAVLPENLIRRSLNYNPVNQQLKILDDKYSLQNKNLYLVGSGKAVLRMAREVESILDSKVKEGIISIPEGSLNFTENSNVKYYEGAKNNLPDSNAQNTTKKIRDLLTKLDENDMLLVLISGGGSALLSLPKKPVSLEEKTKLIKMLANSGADIQELNTIRKRLSDIKGGQLAIQAHPAKVVSLILSDIVGDPIDLIASGPTVENEDDPTIALRIINKYALFDKIPISIKDALQDTAGGKPFPKNNVKNYVIGSNKLSIAAAQIEAENLHYHSIQLSNAVTGNLKDVAREYATLTKYFCDYLIKKSDEDALVKHVESLNIPGLTIDHKSLNSIKNKDICLILGGEITVEVKGNGKGGRNQQLALEFSKYISEFKDNLENLDIYFLSAGTDGIDGPTDAAGAVGYMDLISDAEEDGIDVNKYLENNDSYNFYKQFGDGNLHVITGHTGTNVMDIHLILIKRSKQNNKTLKLKSCI